MIYHLAGWSVLLYLVTLGLLNLIPHLSVRSLGWFSLCNITIDLGHTRISISKVKLKFNWLYSRDPLVRLSVLEVHDLQFRCTDPGTSSGRSPVKKPRQHKPRHVEDALTFLIPKIFYDAVLYYKLTERLSVHFLRTSIYHKATHELLQIYTEYCRIEVAKHSKGYAKFKFMVLNGELQEVDTQNESVPLFRSIEFSVVCDLSSSCPIDKRNKVRIVLDNFKAEITLSKLLIPIDKFIDDKPRSVEPKKPRKPLDSLEPQIRLLEVFFPVFTSFKFTMDEFTFQYFDFEVSCSNLSSTLIKELAREDRTENLTFLLFLTSFKLLHKQTRCLGIPSINFKTSTDPITSLKAINDAIFLEDEEATNYINTETNLSLTSPHIEIYYDQIREFRDKSDKCEDQKPSKEVKKKDNDGKKFDISKILEKLKNTTARLIILDFSVYIHLPCMDFDSEKDTFNRNSSDNVLVTHTSSAVVNTYASKNFRLEARRKKQKINSFFRVKNWRSKALGNSLHFSKASFLCVYDIKGNRISFNFYSKLIKIQSINDVVFLLVRRIRNEANRRYNARYQERLNLQKENEQYASDSKTNVPEDKVIELFEMLPEFVSTVRFKVSAIETDIICKDGLPSYIIKGEDGKDIDLGDYKRGVCLRIQDPRLNYKKHKEEVQVSVESVTLYTVSDCVQEYVEDFDEVSQLASRRSDDEMDGQSDMSSLNTTFSDVEDTETKKIKKVFSLHNLVVSNKGKGNRDKNQLYLTIPEIDGRIDMFFFWSIIYAKTLLQFFAPTVKKQCTREAMRKLERKSKVKVKFDAKIDSIALVVRLPNHVDVMVEVDTLRLSRAFFEDRNLSIKYTRLYVIQPATKLWSRLLIISEPKINLDLQSKISESKVEVMPSSVRLNIPHAFLFYTVIDNILTLAKAIKQIVRNFKHFSNNINDFSQIMPEEKPAIILPEISVKTKAFGITLESDPFEVQLAQIFKLGTIVQRERLKKWKLFEQKEKDLLENSEPDDEDRIELTNSSPSQLYSARTPSDPRMLKKMATARSKTSMTLQEHVEESDGSGSELSRSGTQPDGSQPNSQPNGSSPNAQPNGPSRQNSQTNGSRQNSQTNDSQNSPPRSVAGQSSQSHARQGSSSSETHSNHHKNILKAPKVGSPLKKIFHEVEGGSGAPSFTENFLGFKNKKRPIAEPKVKAPNKKTMTRSEAKELIKQAREELNKEFGSSWIKKYRIYDHYTRKKWTEKGHHVWGLDEVQSIISDKFDILDYSRGEPLLGGLFKNLDLTLKKSNVDIDKFLYEHSSKQPKLIYTILVPLYISLKSSSLYMFIKDYPLPLASFPESDGKRHTIHLWGDFIVNEMLVTTREEMRYIFVPFSPAAPPENDDDNFYSTYVPRTLTPVKFAGDLTCDLDTDRTCVINWSKSYQAAFSAIGQAFDNFTKPEVDHSPIGWWDKIPLVAHGKMVFNVKNELAFHLKSSSSPYKVVGKSAGFVFIWKDNVCLKINGSGDSRDVLRLESDEFVLLVPDYLISERRNWDLFRESTGSTNVEEYRETVKKYSKTVVSLKSDEKVVWIFGMTFERNKDPNSTRLSDDEERVSTFQNHWDVRITNPAFEGHQDSYRDYRSDYIHMALTVVSESKNGKAVNSGYLTPLTFEYFFYWWSTLNDIISLPIRQGKLFNEHSVKKSSIKTGPHLFTVKYLLIFEPLTISHTYMHFTEEELNGAKRLEFTGLKGKFKRCTIDLHQRKELVRYVNDRLGINTQVLHMKMNSGEVNVEEADLRFVNAVFNNRSMRGWLCNFLMKNETANQVHHKNLVYDWKDHSPAHLDWDESAQGFDEDMSWIDLDDFRELELPEQLSPNPKVVVTPFCYSPKFNYFREFSLRKEGPYPFGKEDITLYDLPTEDPDQAQANLLTKRIKELKSQIKESKQMLTNMKNDTSTKYKQEAYDRVKNDLQVNEERLDVVESIWEGFAGKPISSNSSIRTDQDLLKPHSLSVYSSHSTAHDLEVAHRLNATATDYYNRFIIHNLQIKWDNYLREKFMIYMQNVSDRKSHAYFMSKEAVDLVESVTKYSTEAEDDEDDEKVEDPSDKFFRKKARNGEEVIDNFTDEIGDNENPEEEDVVNKYLIKLIHPQIQLVSEKDPDACILISSKDLEIRIVNVTTKGMNQIISENSQLSGTIESRYGVLFHDSHIFVFKKDDKTVAHPHIHYGKDHQKSDSNWPPWVESEVCYDSSWFKSQLVAERNTMALIYRKPNYLFTERKSLPQGNEIVVHLAKIVINTTSQQYSTMYYIVTDLLVHNKTHRDIMLNRLDKIVSISDSSDFEGLDDLVLDLQDFLRTIKELLLQLHRNDIKLTDQEEHDRLVLELEYQKRLLKLDVVMKGLGLRSSKIKHHKQDARFWFLCADQLIWHLLEENREPFVDFALARAVFKRVDSFDGSNSNMAEISMIQGFNLQEHAYYPEMLSPRISEDTVARVGKGKAEACSEQEAIISMSWQMLNAIGGIQIMRKAKLSVKPLNVRLDYDTTKKLFQFLFPSSDAREAESKFIHNAKKEIQNQTGEQDSSELEDTSSGDKRGSGHHKLTRPFHGLISKHKHSSSESSSFLDSLSLSRGSGSQVSSDNSSTYRSKGHKSEHSPSSKTKHHKSKETSAEKDDVDEITEVIDRSSRYLAIGDIELKQCEIHVSFKAPIHLNVLNVHELGVVVPTLRYKNKFWSTEELVVRLRKDLTKVIVQHTGKIIGNKFKIKKRKAVVEPLKQIADYEQYMTINDLQKEGRDRDFTKTSANPHEHQHPHHHKHHHDQHASLTQAEEYFEKMSGEEEDDDTSGISGIATSTK